MTKFSSSWRLRFLFMIAVAARLVAGVQAQTAPNIDLRIEPLAENIVYVGGQVRLTASISISGATTSGFQWNLNGVPIAGASGTSLLLNSVTVADSGSYTLTATAGSLSVTSSPRVLEVLARAPNNAVDPIFVASVIPTGTTNAVPSILVQPNGGLLVSGPFKTPLPNGNNSGLVRLDQTGAEDPSFHVDAGVDGGTVAAQFLEPDGKIIVNGTFTTVNGAPTSAPARLNSDGSLDLSFHVDPGLEASVMLPDGRLLAFEAASTPGDVIVRRLTENGAVDPSFTSYVVALPIIGRPVLQTIDAKGRVLVAVSHEENVFTPITTFLVRLLPDGRLDPTFIQLRKISGAFRLLQMAGDKPAYATNIRGFEVFSQLDIIARLNEDGSDDASFSRVATSLTPDPSSSVFTPDGGMIWISRSTFDGSPQRIRRYDAHGAVVPGSVPRLDSNGSLITDLRFLPNGQLLAVGNFTSLNGVPTSRIALLNLSGETFETRLANLSLRTRAGNADQTLIAGFVVGSGTNPLTLLTRGIGPALADYGVKGQLSDPRITLYQDGSTLGANNDWDPSLSAVFASVGAFALKPGSLDAALLPILSPGVYSLHVAGANLATGVALAEIYDTGPQPASASVPRLINLSGRSRVENEGSVVAGFVVSGTGIKRLLIRAVGPGLLPYGVADPLAEPRLSLYRQSELLLSITGNSFATAAAATAVGAFDLDVRGKDAALVIDLSPGVYSAQVNSDDGTAGVALIEIYEVP